MKRRLDELLILRKFADDLVKARALIGAGEVLVDDRRSDKAGALCDIDATIRVKTHCPYVSRGGFKLQAGISHFGLNITGRVCVDVGASSGGFTDCLLQNGAGKVYAVDVSYGLLDWKLRQDPRVVVIERFNARNLSSAQIKESIDLAVFDAAFISLTKLIPAVLPLFKKEVALLALIKPQFELPKEKIGRGGVVKNDGLHQEALDTIQSFALSHHLRSVGVLPSPILGPKGNKEFLIYLKRDAAKE